MQICWRWRFVRANAARDDSDENEVIWRMSSSGKLSILDIVPGGKSRWLMGANKLRVLLVKFVRLTREMSSPQCLIPRAMQAKLC